MSNFTCGENMMLPALFRGGKPDVIKKTILEYMKELRLPEVMFNGNVHNISGGQRQRLAFIRALATDFTVLFGDEPTGNLDPNTAFKAMGVLKSFIKKNNKTGIIVSHDISLAEKFADRIIPITVAANRKQGEIEESNIYIRHGEAQWKQNEQIKSNIYNELLKTISPSHG